MPSTDIVLITDHRWVAPDKTNWYARNVLLEDQLVGDVLERKGYNVDRKSWDDAQFNWAETQYAIFRTTWDYFNRIVEFTNWFGWARTQTHFINPAEMIEWNIDKHYLQDLEKKGVRITDTIYIEPGDERSLEDIVAASGWDELILKPAISGGARHTYRFRNSEATIHEKIFRELIVGEAMMLQEFQRNVLKSGEVAHMVFGGKYSHSVLKLAKPGDFRVQDDYGGSVNNYRASDEEVKFAEMAVSACEPIPVYARVDVIRNNRNEIALIELELIEPELWMRHSNKAAELFADAVVKYIESRNQN